MTAGEAAARVLEALEAGKEVAEVVVTASDLASVAVGARMLVWAARVEGGLGDEALDAAAARRAREALRGRKPLHLQLTPPGGRCALYVEPHAPPEALVIVGAGHIAQPLCTVGALLGFRVAVLDDRPGFATRERFPEADRVLRADFSEPFREVGLGPSTYLVLATRGHRHDFEVLVPLLRSGQPLAYVGMVASRRRVRATREALLREGIEPGRLERLHAPVGLDIGAETPAEIAVAIAAEMVKVGRTRGG